MHSYWISTGANEGLVESVQFRRGGSPQRVQSIEQIERFAESLERDYHILEIICDVDCSAPAFVKMFDGLLEEIAQQGNRPNSAD